MWGTIIVPILKNAGVTILKGAGLGLGAALSMKVVDRAFPDKVNKDVLATAEKMTSAVESTANALNTKISDEKASTDARLAEMKKHIADSQSAMNSEIISIKKSVNDFQIATDNGISILKKHIDDSQSAMISEIATKVISELKPKSVSAKSTARRKKTAVKKNQTVVA